MCPRSHRQSLNPGLSDSKAMHQAASAPSHTHFRRICWNLGQGLPRPSCPHHFYTHTHSRPYPALSESLSSKGSLARGHLSPLRIAQRKVSSQVGLSLQNTHGRGQAQKDEDQEKLSTSLSQMHLRPHLALPPHFLAGQVSGLPESNGAKLLNLCSGFPEALQQSTLVTKGRSSHYSTGSSRRGKRQGHAKSKSLGPHPADPRRQPLGLFLKALVKIRGLPANPEAGDQSSFLRPEPARHTSKGRTRAEEKRPAQGHTGSRAGPPRSPKS